MTEPPTLSERVGRAAAWNLASILVLGFVSLGTGILLARVLDQAQYAAFSLFVATVSSLLPLTDFGLSASIPKFAAAAMSREGARGLKRTLLLVAGLKLLVWGVAGTALLVFSGPIREFLGIPQEAPDAFLAAAVAVTLLDLLSDVFLQGLSTCLAQKPVQIVRVCESLTLSGTTIVLVLAGGGVSGVLVAFIASSTVKLALSSVFLALQFRRVPPGTGAVQPVSEFLPELLRHASTMYVTKVMGYFGSPAFAMLVMGSCTSTAVVSRFAVAVDLAFRVSEFVCSPLQGLLFPIFANLAMREQADPARRAFRVLTRFYGIALLPTAAGLFALAPSLLPVLYSASYAGSTPYFQWLIACVALEGLFLPVASSALMTAGRYRPVLACRLPIVAVAVVLSAALRAWGPVEAIALVCGGRVAASWLLAWAARVSLGVQLQAGFLLRLALVAIAVAVPMTALAPSAGSTAPGCVLLILGYAVVWWALFKATGGIGREDRERLAGIRLPMAAWVLRLL